MIGWMKRWLRRIGYLLDREREERELEEEMRIHIEMETRDLIERGVPAEEARRRALVRFAGVDRHREEVRDARGIRWLDDLRQDLVFAFRSLRRSPGFTAAALLILALGIGATTAIFGVVEGVLLSPLPYPDSDRLVRVWMAAPSRGEAHGTFSVPSFRDARDRTTSLSHLSLYTTFLSGMVLTGDGPAEEVPTAYVAGDFFGTFGEPALVGRTLRPDEEDRDNRVVVLSHRFWQSRFGGDRSVVGRALTLDGEPFRVVGVMPPDFAAPDPEVDAWAFLSVVDQSAVPWKQRYVRFLQAVGRLEPGVSVERARTELSSVAEGLSREYPESNGELTAMTVEPLRDVMVGDVRRALWVVLGAVGFLLAIACVNVAGLLVARGARRRADGAVRMSLGAGRGRIVRQLLTESFLLAVLGGLGGLGIAWAGTHFFVTRGAELIPRTAEVALDAPVLAFAALLTLLTTLLFGVLPALRTTDLSLSGELRSAQVGGGGGRGRAGGRLRQLLVAAEVAIAVLLVVGAGLMIRSLVTLRSVDPGFEPEGAVAMTLTLSLDRYPERAQYMDFYRDILDRVGAIPGVTAVGSMRSLPTRGGGEQNEIAVPGVWEPGPEDDPYVDFIHVGGEAFRALGIRFLAGRSFDPGIGSEDPTQVVVNEALVGRFFQGTEAVGRSLRLGGADVEVVGVVEDVRHGGLAEAPRPTVYVDQEQDSRIVMAVVARVGGDRPERVLGDMRSVVRSLDPDQPVTELLPLEALMRESTARPRFLTVLLASFAVLATLLAALGLYGVIAYVVRQRMSEVGLRMALGARRVDVVGLVMRQGMAPVLAGLAAGLGGASLLSGLMESILFETRTLDPVAFLSAAAVPLLAALAACLVPAARASRLPPADVLRSE